jgi:hypothetical protein
MKPERRLTTPLMRLSASPRRNARSLRLSRTTTTRCTAPSTPPDSSAPSSGSSATAPAAPSPNSNRPAAAAGSAARNSNPPRPAPTASPTQTSAGTSDDIYTENAPLAYYLRGRDSVVKLGRKQVIDALHDVGRRWHPGETLKDGEEIYKFAPRKMPARVEGDELKSLIRGGAPPASTSTASCTATSSRPLSRPSRTSLEVLDEIGHWWDRQVQGRVKTILTVPNPQYHLTNLYGDLFNAYKAVPACVARQEPRDQRRRAHLQGTPRGRRQDTRQAGRPERRRRQGRRRQDQPGRTAQGSRGARLDRAGLHRPRPRRSPRPARQGSRAAPRARARSPAAPAPASGSRPAAQAPGSRTRSTRSATSPSTARTPSGSRYYIARRRKGDTPNEAALVHQPPPVRLRRHDAVRAVRAPAGPAVLHVHRPQLPAAGPRPDRAARQVRQPREGPRGRPEGQQASPRATKAAYRSTSSRASRSPSPARATCSTRSSPRPTSGGSPSRTRATT